ncbi:hypothetical protein ACP4OV_007944 [Aristida adscensionis]
MYDIWRAVQWWDEWQLRILVVGSLGIQWFLLVAAPMRKYTMPRCFRTIIWLAYIGSDALAIYALATLFNRHVRAANGNCGGNGSKESLLEVLWAPVLLIHLGGQEELSAYEIEDNELWTRHTVTLVSQVAVALYAFYKSWPGSSDRKLLASAVLLFIIGVLSFSEKPWALKRASINRLASISATIQGTRKRSKLSMYLDDLLFSDWYRFSFKSGKGLPNDRYSEVALSEGDKVSMVLSDMSLSAAADDLVQRGTVKRVEDVLRPLSIKADDELKGWLRGAFGFIYTRANVVFTHTYLVYHLLVVPALHIAVLSLFAASDKRGYNRTDVKTTYILLCFTAALDILAVFIRQLLYRVMFMAGVPALCETVPGYNLVDAVSRRRRRDTGWLLKCATRAGCKEEYFDCRRGESYTSYKKVSAMVLADLVDAHGRDLASYRIFTVPDPSTRVPVGRDGVTQLLPPSEVPVEVERVGIPRLGAGSPFKSSFFAEHYNRPSSREEFGGPPGMEEEMPPSSSSTSHALRSQKATAGDTGEIRIMISPGAETSITTEHNHQPGAAGVPEPDDGPGRSVFFIKHSNGLPAQPRSEEPLPRDAEACWHDDATERQPTRFIRQESLKARINWALSKELQEVCGPRIRGSLRGSFDRSVLVWHIATDLCFRLRGAGGGRPPSSPGHPGKNNQESDDEMEVDKPLSLRMECAEVISNYMAHLLNFHPDMLLTGSRWHLVTEAMREIEAILDVKGVDHSGQAPSQEDLRKIIEMYSAWPRQKPLLIHKNSNVARAVGQGADKEVSLFHIPEACRLAKELLDLDVPTRWKVMYRVWLGMLFYSASMCRGYLHAKSLGEGGEFLSFVWLVLSLKGAKTLADKLQMLEADEEPKPQAPQGFEKEQPQPPDHASMATSLGKPPDHDHASMPAI